MTKKEMKPLSESEVPICPSCTKPLREVENRLKYAKVFEFERGAWRYSMDFTESDSSTLNCGECGEELTEEAAKVWSAHSTEEE